MPKLRLVITWATPVAIEKLGAHIEAYVKSQPAINTLRLCNRFGTGEKVAVNKLPVELMEHIEGYYLADQRSQCRANWKLELRCWKAKCKPLDHIEDDDVLQEMMEEWKETVDREVWMESTDAENMEMLGEFLLEHRDESVDTLPPYGSVDAWRKVHDKRKSEWEKKTGAPGHEQASQLDTYNETLKKHFGLEAWTSHYQTDIEWPKRWEDTPVGRSTMGFLCLPDGLRKTRDWKLESRTFDEMDEMPVTQLPSEACSAVYFTSFASLESAPPTARFAHAMRVLNLKPEKGRLADTEVTKTAAQASSDDKPPKEPVFPRRMVLASSGRSLAEC